MSYKTILVHLDFAGSANERLAIANGLAETFDAKLIGFAGSDVPLYAEADTSGIVMEAAAAGMAERLQELQSAFMAATPAGRVADWRSAVGSVSRSLSREARAADLILTGNPPEGSSNDLGSIALTAGRPILVAANGASRLDPKKVVIGWKDTKEARRAVRDALPFLLRAEAVIVATVHGRGDSDAAAAAVDVANWLGRHGVKATTTHAEARGLIASERLAEIVQDEDADLLVTGAYGHSRFMEWAFGGVTQELLHGHQRINRLVSG